MFRSLLLLFIASFLGFSIGAEMIWSTLVQDQIYHCTDEIGFGFLAPGDWYHPPHDTIQEGWGNERLWGLWFKYLMVVATLSTLPSIIVYAIARRGKETKALEKLT